MILPIYKNFNGKYVFVPYGSKSHPFKSLFIYNMLREKEPSPLFVFKPLGLLSKTTLH